MLQCAFRKETKYLDSVALFKSKFKKGSLSITLKGVTQEVMVIFFLVYIWLIYSTT